jgi:leader peptidase (prepilin peptidase)/N-methyltransferase
MNPDGSMILAALVYGGILARLAWLDFRHFWLPDRLTLPLAGLGLALNLTGFGPAGIQALTGAICGWASLAAVAYGYRRWRGVDGMGGGDPKLFAAIGAWSGWLLLPQILLAAALLGLLAAAVLVLRGKNVTSQFRLPFGTPLALAAWPVWLWQTVILSS